MSDLVESWLLEVEIVYNDKSFFPNNTEMYIKVLWKISVQHKKGHVVVNPICEKVFGSTTMVTNNSSLKKTVKLEFETDDSWVYETIKRSDCNSFDIFPDKGIVDFDKKHVKIFF